MITPFKIERYFAEYEFAIKYLLSCSDCESLTLSELLALADKQSLEAWHNLSLGYTESQGNPLLRAEIAKLYTTISPEQVVVVVPEEGIFISMQVLLEPGDHVIVPFPAYQSLYEVAKNRGCDLSFWHAEEESGWSFDIDKLEAMIQKNTKLIVLNFPHNPTGFIPSREQFKRILAIAQKHNIFVFSDEMYRFLEYDAADTLDSASDLYSNAISLFGMSKTFSLPGLRIGWLTTRNETVLKKLRTFKDYTTICSSAPSEMLALIALRNKDAIVAQNRALIQENLMLAEDFFMRYPDLFTWTKPKAGSIAFPKLNTIAAIETICQDIIAKKNLMVLPSSVYEGDKKLYNNFRLGLGRKNFKEVLQLFEAYVQQKILSKLNKVGSYDKQKVDTVSVVIRCCL